MNLMAKVAAIELVEDEVRLAVVKTGPGGSEVLETHSARATYDDPDEQFEARVAMLRTVAEQVKNKPTAWVLCASSAYAVVRNLRIPFKGRKRVSTAVPFELEPYLAFPLEELMLDYLVVHEVGNETEVLAAGMRRNALEECLALMAGAEIPIDGITLDTLGITNVWLAGGAGSKGMQVLLHLREDCAMIVITYQKRVASFRAVPLDSENLLEDTPDLAREVQHTLRAFETHWQEPEKPGDSEAARDTDALHNGLQLTGLPADSPLCDTLAPRLSELLGMPVEVVLLTENLKGELPPQQTAGGLGNVWEPVLGAALGAAGGGVTLNFMDARQDWGRLLRGSISHLMFASCLALLFLMGWMVYYVKGAEKYSEEAARINDEVAEITAQILELEDQGLPGVQTDLFADPPMLDLLVEISRMMPGNRVDINNIRMAPTEARSAWIVIQGQARSVDSFNEVFAALQRSDFFEVDPNPDISIQGEVTRFTVRLFRDMEEAEHGA